MYTISIQHEDFSLEQTMLLAEQAHINVGAVVAFVGKVRGGDHDKPLSHLYLEYLPQITEAEIQKIIEQAKQRWPLLYVNVTHRIGQLTVGQNIVMVVTACEHRKDAYHANEFIMDFLKTNAPFWKKEVFKDGQSHWVEMKQSDIHHTYQWDR